MARRAPRPAQPFVGLELGSTTYRAVEIGRPRRAGTPIRMAEVEVPAGVMQGGEIVDDVAARAALKALWKQGHFRSRRVVVGLANHEIVVRGVELPRLSHDDLRSALAFELADIVPFSTRESVVDCHEIDGDGSEGGGDRLLATVAHQVMVERVIAVLQKAGLRVHAIDVVPFALVRAMAGHVPAGPAGLRADTPAPDAAPADADTTAPDAAPAAGAIPAEPPTREGTVASAATDPAGASGAATSADGSTWSVDGAAARTIGATTAKAAKAPKGAKAARDPKGAKAAKAPKGAKEPNAAKAAKPPKAPKPARPAKGTKAGRRGGALPPPVTAVADPATFEPPVAELVAHLSGDVLSVAIHHQGRPRFARLLVDLQTGTAAITQALEEGLAEIETFRRRGSLGTLDAPRPTVRRDPLAEAIRSTLEYFAFLPGSVPVASIHVSGTNPRAGEIAAALGAIVDKPVDTSAPLARFVTASTGQAADNLGRYTAAYGLAIDPSGRSDMPPLLSLLPRTVLATRQRAADARSVIGGLALAGAAVAVGMFVVPPSAGPDQSEIDAAAARIVTVRGEIAGYASAQAVAAERAAREADIDQLLGRSLSWASVITDLHRVAPANVPMLVAEATQAPEAKVTISGQGGADGAKAWVDALAGTTTLDGATVLATSASGGGDVFSVVAPVSDATRTRTGGPS